MNVIRLQLGEDYKFYNPTDKTFNSFISLNTNANEWDLLEARKVLREHKVQYDKLELMIYNQDLAQEQV